MANNIRFRLTRNRKPVSWQLPLSNMMLPKEQGGNLKRVQYIKGVDSVFVEDYKGDEKPQKIWFEDGVLDVNRNDKPLIFLLKAHKFFNKEYEIVDEDAKAGKELKEFEVIEKALAKVNIVNDDELKANGLILIGEGTISWTPERVRAELKRRSMVYETAQALLQEMNSGNFHAKYAGALAVMKGVLVINHTRTAVTWPDGKVVVSVPAGLDPISRLTDFLSGNNDLSKITLQEIGEKSKRVYVKNPDVMLDDVVDAALDKSDSTDDGNDLDDTSMDLEEARQMYKESLGTDVPNNKKNDLDWILSKLD